MALAGWPLLWKSGNCRNQGKIRKLEKKSGRSGNLSKFSERKSYAIFWFNLSVSFYQNTISRSQRNFSGFRGKPGNSQGTVKDDESGKSGHPDWINCAYRRLR